MKLNYILGGFSLSFFMLIGCPLRSEMTTMNRALADEPFDENTRYELTWLVNGVYGFNVTHYDKTLAYRSVVHIYGVEGGYHFSSRFYLFDDLMVYPYGGIKMGVSSYTHIVKRRELSESSHRDTTLLIQQGDVLFSCTPMLGCLIGNPEFQFDIGFVYHFSIEKAVKSPEDKQIGLIGTDVGLRDVMFNVGFLVKQRLYFGVQRGIDNKWSTFHLGWRF